MQLLLCGLSIPVFLERFLPVFCGILAGGDTRPTTESGILIAGALLYYKWFNFNISNCIQKVPEL
jgi:hypothetical protein